MRVRPVPLLAAIFGSAAAVALVVVLQLPREGEVSSPSQDVAAPVMPAETSPAIEPPADPADGLVEVRVTAGGEPQEGAAVRLYLAPDAADAPWRRAGEGRTGRDGVARVPARPGSYLVAVRARGLATGRAEVARARGEEVARTVIELAPPAALSGTAAAGGAPVARARVRAIPVPSSWPSLEDPSAPPEETVLAESDAQGSFRLEGLSPGTWSVAIEAAGFHPVVRRVMVPADPLDVRLEPLGLAEGRIVHADGRAAEGALVSAVSAEHGAGARSGADGRFTLAAPAGSYVLTAALGELAGAAAAPVAIAPGAAVRDLAVRLGPGAAVDGALIGPDGAPAAGAQVALFAHGSREPVARAAAGRDGRFTVGGLAPGAYDVRAAAPAASPAWIPGVTLAPGARFPLRIALDPLGSIEGTVRDPNGRALAGVRVRAAVHDEGPGAPPVEARTDFEGRFRVDLPVGRVEVVARQEGVLAGTAGAVRVVPGRAARLDLVLPEPGLLAGRVTAGRATPPGTVVIAVAMGAGPGILQIARAPADSSGNYRMSLPAGEYRVHAAPGGAEPADLRVAPGFARVEAGRTSALDPPLAPADREDGLALLVLEPGGAPSPGALVTLARPDDGRIALATAAGEDGRVTLGRTMGMSGERVTIRARNGGRTGVETLALPDAGTIHVRLSPAGALDGVLRGARVAAFTVEVSSTPVAGSWRTLDVHRFVGDRFELDDLPSEPLRLSVRTDDGRLGTAEVRLAPGERRSVEIALR